MTLSIRNKLLADVATALELIDGTGKYENDITTPTGGGVQLWAGGGINIQKTPTAVLYWLQDGSVDEPVGYLTRFLDVVVDVFQTDAGGPATSAEAIETLLSDVERAVLTDPERAGVAKNVDTAHVQSTPFPSQADTPSIGGTVRFRIRYNHVRAEPDNDGS